MFSILGVSWKISSFIGFLSSLSLPLVAVGSFANFIPEIAELLGNQPKYAGNYVVIFTKGWG